MYENPFETVISAREEINFPASIYSVHPKIKNNELKNRCAANEIYLTEVNKKQRWEFAQQFVDNVNLWDNAVFSDENSFKSCYDGRLRVYRPSSTSYDEQYTRATHPISYILSWDNDHSIKDLTKRYCLNWNTVTRKLRVDDKWWNETLLPYKPPRSARDREEDEDLARQQLEQPLPTTISEFKNHPLYVIKRHLLKFEAIYPPDALILGFVRNEPIYSRDCVHVLHSRDIWLKHAKVVKPGEKPYKIVKARPKYDKVSFNLNIRLVPGLNKIARKMNIDCAPAIVGFDFHGGWSHPTYDGFIVCEEFSEQLIAAWYQEQEESEKRAQEKIEKRVYDNWRRLIRGLLIRERLKAKYDFGESSTVSKSRKSKKGLILKKKKFTVIPILINMLLLFYKIFRDIR
ncbi:dna repair protein xp-c / rad4 [Holotrichia oblita]|uniref:Dna repair protein xp-c / rad4 n=1 Tax=Holotrichia oblita TaxID=644536 RepID=A0ACB9TNG1_HOLOL|nr:dna repair protein xp-c / rad4 [Holotrichia oblita]